MTGTERQIHFEVVAGLKSEINELTKQNLELTARIEKFSKYLVPTITLLELLASLAPSTAIAHSCDREIKRLQAVTKV